MPAVGAAARSASMDAMPPGPKPRASTTTMSGVAPPRGARSSVTPIGTAPERSCWPIAFLNASSSLTMRPVNCAMRPL
jgi:hypothetical protein